MVRMPVFKLDRNLHFNMNKTMILTRDPTARHVYEREQYFLQNDPELRVDQGFTEKHRSGQVFGQGVPKENWERDSSPNQIRHIIHDDDTEGSPTDTQVIWMPERNEEDTN
jgi:hypothetical protein